MAEQPFMHFGGGFLVNSIPSKGSKPEIIIIETKKPSEPKFEIVKP